MTHTEAQTLVDLLLEGRAPSTLSWGAQVFEYGRIQRRGTPAEQAHVLAALYAEKDPDPPRLLMIERFEELLLPAMAEALGTPVGKLRSLLHEGRPAFGGDAPWRPEADAEQPATPLAPSGWEALGTFQVFGGALVLGESPDAPEHDDGEAVAARVRPALNGVWFTWSVRPPASLWRRLLGRADDGLLEQVAIHETALPDAAALLSRARPLGAVWVHGGTSSAVDVEVREDRRVLANLQAGEETGRGFTVGLGGDGAVTWRGAEREGQLVLVSLATSD